MKRKQYDPDFDKTKQQLFYIFTYYCSFADRDNYQVLKIQNYRRMLADSQATQKLNQNSQLDLLFAQNKKNMNGIDFQIFVTMLPQIAKVLYPNQPAQTSIKKMIKINLHTLFEYIQENTDFGSTIQCLFKAYFSQSCFTLLKSLSPTLYRIYCQYFDPISIKIISQKAQIFKKLTLFTKNFQIMPQLLSKTQNYIIFNEIVDQQIESAYKQWFDEDKKNKQVFRYFNFLKYLLVISLVSNKKIVGVQVSQIRKLINLLQVMQLSEGFTKICNNSQINLHLIPNDKLVKELQRNSNLIVTPHLGSSPQKRSTLQTPNSINSKFLEHYQELNKKFISFCLHGESIGNSYLTHKKAIDIFKQMNIGLKQSQIEIYLAAVNKTLDFQAFIHVLQKISQKQFIEIEQLIHKLVTIPISSQIQHQKLRHSRVTAIQNRQQYRNCLNMLQQASQFLEAAFIMECQPNIQNKQELSFISLNSYLKIMHDFEISPLYLNKQSLIEIFRHSIKKSYDFMNFKEFKDSFIISLSYLDLSVKGTTEEMSAQTKFIIMLQRIKDSRGAAKIYKRFQQFDRENFLIALRQTYRQFYPKQGSRISDTNSLQQLLQ